MKRWIIGIILSTLLLILITAVSTPTSTAFNVANLLIPGELRYKHITGMPIGPITISDVSYHYQDTYIYIKKLRLAWRPIDLLSGKLDIEHLNAEHIRIILPKKEETTASALPKINLPLTLRIKDATLYDLKVGNNPDIYSIHLRRVKLNATIRADQLTVEIQGDHMLIMNTPEYVIYATPTLTVDIKGYQIHVTGTLVIPQAELKPISLGDTTILPEDVVFVGPTAAKEIPWVLTTDVNITIGNHVFVDSHGLTGRLLGELSIVKSPAHDYMATGRVGIAHGIFTTHNRTLIITPDSEITFTQSPLKNPNLNIRAVKQVQTTPAFGSQTTPFGKITVGLNILGTLRNPNVSLFSSAPLSQADILSYLLLGHPANANTPSNVSSLLQTIDTLNIGGEKATPGGMADKITQGLGLTEFGVEPETTLDALGTPLGQEEMAFVVGRYISPRIYVHYSRGLVIPINIVQIRYLLGTHWAIQTESSSLGNGGDILYTIQKN